MYVLQTSKADLSGFRTSAEIRRQIAIKWETTLRRPVVPLIPLIGINQAVFRGSGQYVLFEKALKNSQDCHTTSVKEKKCMN